MTFGYYVLRIPYTIFWYLLHKLHLLRPVVFYCGDPLDYHIFAPVQKHLPLIPIVTDKPEVRSYLSGLHIRFHVMPSFPQAVIMARHSTHKFPCARIIKIGMRHGAYHFKKMTSAVNYNAFDVFLMTSHADVEAGKQIGVTVGKAVGFPKLDPAFDGTLTSENLSELKTRLGFTNDKPILLFTATFDDSGLSAVEHWYDKLEVLTPDYHVMVTLHPWMNPKYRDRISHTQHVHLINDYNIVPYLMLADAVIGDNSSILAECCALDKTMITFKTQSAKRSLDEIDELLDKISYRVPSFHMLLPKIIYALQHRDELQPARQDANHLMFDDLDGKAGERAARAIRKHIPDLE